MGGGGGLGWSVYGHFGAGRVASVRRDSDLRTEDLWETGALAWVFTLGLLLVIRHAVVSRLVRPLRQRAMVDALTGVRRPDVFWEQAEIVTRALTAAHSSWVFTYLDLDDFKQVNDILGHQAGDTVLRAFGTLLKAHARQNDLVDRLGGEEFGWILSGCTTERRPWPPSIDSWRPFERWTVPN